MKSIGIIVALGAILSSELVASTPFPEDSAGNLVGAARTSGVLAHVPLQGLAPPAAHSRQSSLNRFHNNFANARQQVSNNGNFQRNNNYEQLRRIEQNHYPTPIVTNNPNFERIASNVNVDRRIPGVVKAEIGNIPAPSPNVFTQTRQAHQVVTPNQIASFNNARRENVAFENIQRPLSAKIGIAPNGAGYAATPKQQPLDIRPGFTRDALNNARRENVAFENIQRPLSAKIGIAPNGAGYAATPKQQPLDIRPGFTRDALKYQMGQNMREIFNKPEVRQAIESKTEKKRYLVVYPDGRIEHVDKLETVAQQYPNYALINGKTAMENIRINNAQNQAVTKVNFLKPPQQQVVAAKPESVFLSKLKSTNPPAPSKIEIHNKVTPVLSQKIVPSKSVDFSAETLKAAGPVIKGNPVPLTSLNTVLMERRQKEASSTQQEPNIVTKTTVDVVQPKQPSVVATLKPVISRNILPVALPSQSGITSKGLTVGELVQKKTDNLSSNTKVSVPIVSVAPELTVKPSATLLTKITKSPVASLIKLPPVSQPEQKVLTSASTSSTVATKTKDIPKPVTTSNLSSSTAALTSQPITPSVPSSSVSAAKETAQIKIEKSVQESPKPTNPAANKVDLVSKPNPSVLNSLKSINSDKVKPETISPSKAQISKEESTKKTTNLIVNEDKRSTPISTKTSQEKVTLTEENVSTEPVIKPQSTISGEKTTTLIVNEEKRSTPISTKTPEEKVTLTEEKVSTRPVIKPQPTISEERSASSEKVVSESVENKSVRKNISSPVTEVKIEKEPEDDILFVLSNEEDSSSVKKVAAIPTTVSKAESVEKADIVTAKEADPSKGPVVWFRTNEPDFLDKLMGDNDFLGAIYFFQVKSSN